MTAMDTKHDTSHIPLRFQDRIVPWVTRWTDEVQPRTVAVQSMAGGRLRATYGDDLPDNRDRHGILWQREGVTRGGAPQWRSINTLRQRACMVHRKCEVCGRKITTPVINWLVPSHLLNLDNGPDPLTTQSPTCDDCAPIALELCPHLLKTEVIRARVLNYEQFGVFGSAFIRGEDGAIQLHNAVAYQYHEPNPEAVLAQQQIVRWTKYVLETP